MAKTLILLAFFLQVLGTCAQSIPLDRRSDWGKTGRELPIPDYPNQVNIADFGAVGDGVTPNDLAYLQALAALAGKPGTVVFPSGQFLFNHSLLLRDSLVVRGQGAAQTVLLFQPGNSSSCIVARGKMATQQSASMLDLPVHRGDTVLHVSTNFQPGDLLLFHFDDSALIFSDWARGTAGQLLEVLEIDAYKITVNHPLRFDVAIELRPRLSKVEPVDDAGVECLKVKRLDGNAPFTSNVLLAFSRRCWIVGVESEKCNFAHFSLEASTLCEVYGCYAQDAFAFGGGGQGYGLVMQQTASDNRAQNNIFRKLRHAMLLQSGATGNVLAYNFSTEPTWVEFPNDGAGDIAVHGNYPSYNLFEGNVCKNIRPDGSHGLNGPFNTFFRNRATGYGLIFTAPEYQHAYNVAANEITGTGLFQGLYVVLGTDHWEQGNSQNGTIVPSGSPAQTEPSLYLSTLPGFLKNSQHLIGPPAAFNAGTLPAQVRFQTAFEKTDCDAQNGLSHTARAAWPAKLPLSTYPNPAKTSFVVSLGAPAQISIFDLQGKHWFSTKNQVSELLVQCAHWPTGTYLVHALGKGQRGRVVVVKI